MVGIPVPADAETRSYNRCGEDTFQPAAVTDIASAGSSFLENRYYDKSISLDWVLSLLGPSSWMIRFI